MKTIRKKRSLPRVNGVSGEVVNVRFSHPTATTVAIAGTFNDWRPDTIPMIPMGEGRWLKKLILPPGTYEYLFVADGNWVIDPLAEKTVPNPFGCVNSVLIVSELAGGRKSNGVIHLCKG